MIYITKTTQPIEKVKKELEAKAKEAGFGVLNSYEFKKILESKGFPIEKDITVFELCNPQGAYQALTEIAAYLFICLAGSLCMKRTVSLLFQPSELEIF